MKVKFVFPKWESFLDTHTELKKTLSYAYYLGDYEMPTLGIATVAALTPHDIEISLTDERIEKIDYDEKVDLVAISFFTPQATRAYEIADEFKKRNITVVMGGIHPTLMYEEAEKHADAVVIGEAELVWGKLLNDFKNKTLQKFYFGEPSDLSNLKLPLRRLFKRKEYLNIDIIQTARGCGYNCPACVIPSCYGKKIRYRPIQEVVKEIESLEALSFYMADDHIMSKNPVDLRYTTELFKMMIPLPHPNFFISTSPPMISLKPEILKLAREAGCIKVYMVFGFDPLSIDAFSSNGDKRKLEELDTIVKKIKDSGIMLMASFALGNDNEDFSSFERKLEFAERNKIELCEFFILTPYPGTPLYQKLVKEKRLLHTNWKYYNGAHVVFLPKNMTPEKLLEGYLFCWKEFYKNKDDVEVGINLLRAFGDFRRLAEFKDKFRESIRNE